MKLIEIFTTIHLEHLAILTKKFKTEEGLKRFLTDKLDIIIAEEVRDTEIWEAVKPDVECETCLGSGEFQFIAYQAADFVEHEWTDCPDCNGKGEKRSA